MGVRHIVDLHESLGEEAVGVATDCELVAIEGAKPFADQVVGIIVSRADFELAVVEGHFGKLEVVIHFKCRLQLDFHRLRGKGVDICKNLLRQVDKLVLHFVESLLDPVFQCLDLPAAGVYLLDLVVQLVDPVPAVVNKLFKNLINLVLQSHMEFYNRSVHLILGLELHLFLHPAVLDQTNAVFLITGLTRSEVLAWGICGKIEFFPK